MHTVASLRSIRKNFRSNASIKHSFSVNPSMREECALPSDQGEPREYRCTSEVLSKKDNAFQVAVEPAQPPEAEGGPDTPEAVADGADEGKTTRKLSKAKEVFYWMGGIIIVLDLILAFVVFLHLGGAVKFIEPLAIENFDG
ncbi:unnamed protein product [Cylicocyclus nassatus]|uniref:Uncharacterized protein n=1 Tax=Cylicocyclus nassatus TaxID=53992 RepID=A0AA36GFQ6_CYLNA|nr:unnamed protein product [Cylicocyclus nassatus]